MTQIIPILSLGLFFGIKHAFEADHVIAVSTIVADQKNPTKAALIGTFWGIGHTTTLFIIGLFVLLLQVSISKNVSITFETLVGLMLIFLGFRVIYRCTHSSIHTHTHLHHHSGNHDYKHRHLHLHIPKKNNIHRHHRSFLIGTVHGLAGSGTIMLLILSTIKSTFIGILYILLFGLGSIIGMTLTSMLLSLPFVITTKKFTNIDKYLQLITGSFSILFGSYLVYSLGVFKIILNKFVPCI